MARFKRLTDAEARSLTRAELLDRVEAEQAYWFRKNNMSDADQDAEREFRRIWHACLSLADAIQAAMTAALQSLYACSSRRGSTRAASGSARHGHRRGATPTQGAGAGRSRVMTSGNRRSAYGPVQLAEYLGASYTHVDRARSWRLIPEPDRGGRRWSAALAEEIRGRWPEIAAAVECAGAVGLKERGWTEAMIRDLLGKPDTLRDNPHYKSAAPMRLWRLQHVEAVEATPEFAQRKARANGQRAAATKAAQTKKLWKLLGG